MCRVQIGGHDRQFLGQRIELTAIALHDGAQIRHLGLHLLQIGLLPLAHLARVLNALLDAGHLRSRLRRSAPG